MLVLTGLALWFMIAIVTALLVGETFWRMGSALPDRRYAVLAARADRIRRHDNVARGVR